jgi:hypothetical protein
MANAPSAKLMNTVVASSMNAICSATARRMAARSGSGTASAVTRRVRWCCHGSKR